MTSSRLNLSFKNMLSGAVGQALTILLSFVSRTIFLRTLTTEYLGINGLFSNILTLLSFAELGIGNAMIFSMYKPLKDKDIQKLQGLMFLYKKAYRVIAVVVAGIGLLLVPFLSFFISNPPNIKENLTIIYLLYLLNATISYLWTHKKSIIIADQKVYIVNISQNIFNIILLIAQAIVLILTHNFILYLCLQITTNLLNNLIVSHIANEMYPFLKEPITTQISQNETKRIFTDIKALTISKIAGVVANGTDSIIISKIMGLTSVGLVSNYSLIINAVNGLFWSFLSGITASIGNLNTEKNFTYRAAIFKQLFLGVYSIYSFASICLLVLLNPFISIWLGKNYLIDNVTVFALVLIIYVSGVNYPCFVFRTTLGYFEQVKYAYVGSAFFNVVLSIILGKMFGLSGVFFATSISRLITSEIADGFYVYRDGLQLSPSIYFIKYYLYFTLFLVNYYITYSVVNQVPYLGVSGFVFKVFICIFVSNSINYIVLYRSEAFAELKLKFLRVASNKIKFRF